MGTNQLNNATYLNKKKCKATHTNICVEDTLKDCTIELSQWR